MVKDEELKRVYGMFTDAWKFYKKYVDVQDTDEFWESVVNESSEISKKYNNDKLAISLVLAVVGEFERRAKEARVNAKTQ